MKLKAIAEQLEIDINRANYYRKTLKAEDLINPIRRGNWLDYSEEDIDYISTLHRFVSEDDLTVTDAIKYIKRGVTPEQALAKVDQLNAQLAAAQKKIVELRKPSFWNKISNWISKFFNKGGGEREVA